MKLLLTALNIIAVFCCVDLFASSTSSLQASLPTNEVNQPDINQNANNISPAEKLTISNSAPSAATIALPEDSSKTQGKKYCLLSLDCCDNRIIVILCMLQYIEQITGIKIQEMFDFIVGGGGSALAAASLGVKSPKDSTKYLYSLSDTFEICNQVNKTLFLSQQNKLSRLFRPGFSSNNLLQKLNTHFGNLTTKDCLSKIGILATKGNGEPTVFSAVNRDCNGLEVRDAFLSEAVYASYATPTKLDPLKITPTNVVSGSNGGCEKSDDKTEYPYCAGGLSATNTTAFGVKMLKDYCKCEDENICVISLGGGKSVKDSECITPIGQIDLDLLSDCFTEGNKSFTNCIYEFHYGDNYLRLEPELKIIQDDFSEQYRDYLIGKTMDYIVKNKDLFFKVAQIIKECRKTKRA